MVLHPRIQFFDGKFEKYFTIICAGKQFLRYGSIVISLRALVQALYNSIDLVNTTSRMRQHDSTRRYNDSTMTDSHDQFQASGTTSIFVDNEI